MLRRGALITSSVRFQTSGSGSGKELDTELHSMFSSQDPGDVWHQPNPLQDEALVLEEPKNVRFVKQNKAPGKFDILSFANCFLWCTTAKISRKVMGPMREWSDEVKYRTGVHLECEPAYPDKISNKEYANADDVEINVWAFGSDRSIAHCSKLLESVILQDPAYVRLGVFRRVPDASHVEWLMLRRINSEMRPPDIPPISLKLPGKYTLLFENYKEAAIRSCWEETGVNIDPKLVYPSGMLSSNDPVYYWRPPIRYFVAELPGDAELRAPLPSVTNYFLSWDSRLLGQSPDPIDQAWSKHANQDTGLAWMSSPLVDELQKPLRGEKYLTIRYSPPPYSNLQDVLNLSPLDV